GASAAGGSAFGAGLAVVFVQPPARRHGARRVQRAATPARTSGRGSKACKTMDELPQREQKSRRHAEAREPRQTKEKTKCGLLGPLASGELRVRRHHANLEVRTTAVGRTAEA